MSDVTEGQLRRARVKMPVYDGPELRSTLAAEHIGKRAVFVVGPLSREGRYPMHHVLTSRGTRTAYPKNIVECSEEC